VLVNVHSYLSLPHSALRAGHRSQPTLLIPPQDAALQLGHFDIG
jgi:hypothetical protein